MNFDNKCSQAYWLFKFDYQSPFAEKITKFANIEYSLESHKKCRHLIDLISWYTCVNPGIYTMHNSVVNKVLLTLTRSAGIYVRKTCTPVILINCLFVCVEA